MRVKIILARPVGLFSLFHQVLEHVALAQKEGSVPLVYFNDACLFWSPSGYNGSRNAWEYYFYPVSDKKIDDYVNIPPEKLERADIWEFKNRRPHLTLPRRVGESQYGTIDMPDYVYVTNLYEGEIIPWIFDLSKRKKRVLGKLVKKHIRVKNPILKKVEDFYASRLEGRHVVGVHIRGGEHSDERGFYVKGGFLPMEFYKKELDRRLEEHPEALVYAASDVADNILDLEKSYPDKVVSYSATRLDAGNQSVGLHTQSVRSGDQAKTADFKARLGEEVLIETLLLSRCDFLVHGPSNISSAAMLFKPDLKHVNVYRKYGMKFAKLRYNMKVLVPKAKKVAMSLMPSIYSLVKRLVR